MRRPVAPTGLPRRAVTVPEAAAQLGVSRWTVYRMVRDGYLVSVKLGPRPGDTMRITVDSIEALLAGPQAVS